MRTFGIACALALAVAACGCDSGPKYVPVSGTVLVDGKPIANLAVVFQPMGTKGNENPGRGSYGTTDASGKFTLFSDGTTGAVIGTHKVAIFTNLTKEQLTAGVSDTGSKDGEAPASKELIPPKYNDQTTLTFEVPAGGTDKADFNLVVKPGK